MQAQTLTDLGSTAPTPGANDIAQLSTSGNKTAPDGLNYYTDNSSPVGQTFTTGTSAMRLVSVAIKTAGLYSGGGVGSPASTPTFYLRIYSISSGTASLLITFSAANPGFTDGDWLQWSGINVPLAANKTYAYTFGTKPSGGGYAALAVATNAYAGGEIALTGTSGGLLTTGSSHSFDAVFDLGLQPETTVPANTPWPMPTYGWNLGNTLEATWGLPNWTQSVFYGAANAGFNAVRIPCSWDYNADKTTWQINPTYMARVKQTVDWAFAAGMYVVINDHWDGGWLENNIGNSPDQTINAKMQSYWTQIATAFAGYDNHLLFAAANEPNAYTPAQVNTLMAYYQTFVNAVRATGGNNANRWLVLQNQADPSWMTYLPVDSTPNRLMLEYHNYSPSLFTFIHNDPSWGRSFYFWGKAYHNPANPSRNATFGEEDDTDSYYQQLANLHVSKGIPVMIGEFGAGPYTALTGTDAAYNSASVEYWIKYVTESARAHGLSPFFWSTVDNLVSWTTGAVTEPQRISDLTGGAAPPPPNGSPYAPSGLVAVTGTGQVSLSWNPGSGATSYNLYRAAESGNEESTTPFVAGITGTSYTDTNLSAGTTYYYLVEAVNASGTSGYSAEAHATVPGVNADPALYNFETDTQNWIGNNQITGLATSSAQHFNGNQSLAVTFSGTAGSNSQLYSRYDVVTPGTTVTFHVWIPAGNQITGIEPFIEDNNWAWTSSWYPSLTANAWNTLTVTVPATAISPLQQLGLRIYTGAAWSGTCYIDSVTVPGATSAPATPTGMAAVSGSGNVVLSWSASATTRNYVIKRSGTSGGPYSAIATTAGVTFTDFAVVNGATYYYVVSAVNDVGESANSAQVIGKPAGLSARYAFEGNVLDTSGNGNNGTATNVTYTNGMVGSQAALFNGTNSRLVIPPSITDDFTVAMWVKTTDTAGSAGGQWWSGKGLVDGEVYGGGADWGTSVVNGKFVLGIGSASGDTTVASTTSINDGTWHHVAATRISSNGAMAVYVDGVLSASGTGPTGSRTWPTQLSIGSIQIGNNYLNGAIDDVRLYGRILTSTEIGNLATVAPPPTPMGLSGLGAGSTVNLSWFSAVSASSYNVKRSGTSGGPYTTVGTNVSATSYSDTGLTSGVTYYYVVSAVNVAGESQNSSELAVTVASTSTVSLTSVAAQDGYITSSGSTNTAGGTTFPTTNPCRLGDDNLNRAYIGILSFDTSSLPDNAVIVSGTLQFKRSALVGTNPFLNHGTCYADIKGGNGFNGSTSLETADFQAAASGTQVATMSNPTTNGAWSSGSLNASGLGLIDKTASSQFRVYFSTPTDNNNANDYISWYPGDDSTASNRPVLALSYYLENSSILPKVLLKFDESSGTAAVDSSGHGWHGTLVNGATWAAGKLSNAVSLSGSAHVTIPAGVVSTLSDFTIATWVKLNSSSNWMRIFDFGTDTTNYMFLTPQNGNTGTVRYSILTSGAGSDQQISGTSPLQTGTWTHVAVTLSGSTGTLYVNGTAVGTNTSMTRKPSSLGSTTQNYIGRSIWSSDPYLNGAIDDFRIYNRALSPSEIVSLAAGPLAAPQNVAATSGSSKITLSWSSVYGATDYTIQRSGSSGGYISLATGISTTTFADTGLAAGATWYYTVTANGLVSPGPASAPVWATTYTAVQNWRLSNFGTPNNSGNAADNADPDCDGWTNAQEYILGTDPNSAASTLKISQMQASGNDMQVSFPSVAGKTYRLERSDTLQGGSWTTVQDNIAGTGSTLQVTDTGGAAQGKRFYRIIVW